MFVICINKLALKIMKKYEITLLPTQYLFPAVKRMLQGKRFGSNKEVIAETEAYFEAKDKSFYKKGIEMLEKRWNECSTFKGDYDDEWG